MATYTAEKDSTNGSDQNLKGVSSLDEKRRAALAEVDNAKFSCVSFQRSPFFHTEHRTLAVGSM